MALGAMKGVDSSFDPEIIPPRPILMSRITDPLEPMSPAASSFDTSCLTTMPPSLLTGWVCWTRSEKAAWTALNGPAMDSVTSPAARRGEPGSSEMVVAGHCACAFATAAWTEVDGTTKVVLTGVWPSPIP